MNVLCVVGTRPEAIKMAPVIRLLRERDAFDVSVLATAQHREMLDQVLRVFDIKPDLDLNIMRPDQSLTDVASAVLRAMDDYLKDQRPGVVLAQGDTTTVMATALACFHARVPFGHVEAGLRTGDCWAPFPEELNRRVAGMVGQCHFAPTQGAADHLLNEGVEPSRVHVTGNTVIDALFYTLHNTRPPPRPVPDGARYILMTCHRRESFGGPVREIFGAVRDVVAAHPDVYVWYPVHPNPHVGTPAREILGNVPHVILTPPLDYVEFVHAMNHADLILTDSGGVQEEAPSLGKPVLVLRDVTERPEGIEAGTCRLVGPHRDSIIASLDELLTNRIEYERMARARNPYGDGHAAERIAGILSQSGR
jgi:UDP-N-acetylglucosamine 2-epimerase (non-hydrolysing)